MCVREVSVEGQGARQAGSLAGQLPGIHLPQLSFTMQGGQRRQELEAHSTTRATTHGLTWPAPAAGRQLQLSIVSRGEEAAETPTSLTHISTQVNNFLLLDVMKLPNNIWFQKKVAQYEAAFICTTSKKSQMWGSLAVEAALIDIYPHFECLSTRMTMTNTIHWLGEAYFGEAGTHYCPGSHLHTGTMTILTCITTIIITAGSNL